MTAAERRDRDDAAVLAVLADGREWGAFALGVGRNWGVDAGAPDLILARGGVVLLAELKSAAGRLGPGQREWGQEIGGTYRLWRPADWGAILAELR